MSIPKKLTQVIQRSCRQIVRSSKSIHKRLMTWLLRSLMGIRHQSRSAQAGFVLPTVTMVILVVVLLTTAIVIRSFDRAKNARNYRVDEAVMAASAPAIERATAKLDLLFGDPRLPRSTPSDDALYNLLASDLTEAQADRKFTFPDEVPLKLAYANIDNNSGILDEDGAGASRPLEEQETVKTAWRYPVDTDGNGKSDSFTLYSILFRSPLLRGNTQGLETARTPLEARTPPMQQGATSDICEGALNTSAKLVSQGGWYKQGSALKKSFFMYTATVPITDVNALGLPDTEYENYKGTAGFTALEYQQDRARVPLSNNAVLFEDDLAIVTGEQFFLNGSITTNGNLFIDGGNIQLYQVSAPDSCFYEASNGKVYVGGNVINAAALDATVDGTAVPVDLYSQSGVATDQIRGGASEISTGTQSAATSVAPEDILNNNQAFQRRISYLVDARIAQEADYDNDPQDVVEQVDEALDAGEDETQARIKALTAYFQDRTRRVPFGEVNRGTRETFNPPEPSSCGSGRDCPLGTGDSLRPPRTWMFPVDPSNGKTPLVADSNTGNNWTGVALNISGDEVEPPATEPDTLEGEERENFVGDRVLVGNGLPPTWYKASNYSNDNGIWVSGEEPQPIDGTTWDEPETNATERSRFTQRQTLAEVGDKSRDGFWELVAAEEPKNVLDNVGGLRVITGAGVYERKNSFLPPPTPGNPSTEARPANAETLTYYDDPTTPDTEQYPVVWPDTMPMSPEVGASYVYANANSTSASSSDWRGTEWRPQPLPDDGSFVESDSNFRPVTRTIDNYTPKYAKGDLRMRATAVYHYAQDIYDPPNDKLQEPIACVSSYYDPTNETTAQNDGALPYQDPGISATNGKSNNGVSYAKPSTRSVSISPQTPDGKGLLGGINTETYSNTTQQLAYQANLVFPNGRFVNPILREALQKDWQDRTLSEQAAIDSTICALEILGGKGPSDSVIDHGTIKEVAFLDSRQIQAIDGWDLPIDVGDLSGSTITYTIPAAAFPGTSSQTDDLSDFVQPGDLITVQGFSSPDLNVTKGLVESVSGNDIEVNSSGSGTANESYTSLPDSQKPWIVGILSGRYDRSLEERYPQEVRATQIDLDLLRKKSIGFNGCTNCPSPEYLLPNSGIIYASRDDALPDLSQPITITPGDTDEVKEQKKAEQENNSPFDSLLDPTRRPNGIMLINGEKLARNDDETFREVEKGLILATNVPAYIKGDFNPHSENEFQTALNATWSNFYTRDNLNPNFACRPDDPRLPDCTTGDTWRSATVIADSMTLLSNDFRFGFRNEGDYDLRNNNYGSQDTLTKRLQNGFLANNYVTSRDFNDATYSNGTGYTQAADDTGDGSSYFNNFVTPVQRRSDGLGLEYVMEICRKLPVSECQPYDWYVGYEFNSGELATATTNLEDIKDEYQANDVSEAQLGPERAFKQAANDGETRILNIRASDLPAALVGLTFDPNRLVAGTTSTPALNGPDQRFARRVAFLRYSPMLQTVNNGSTTSTGNRFLVGLPGNSPVTLGIDNSSNLVAFTPDPLNIVATDTPGGLPVSNGVPRKEPNSLWYRDSGIRNQPYNSDEFLDIANLSDLTGTTAAEQPILVPVLQIHAPKEDNNFWGGNYTNSAATSGGTRWIQRATETTFDLIMAVGNTPPRPGEPDGGLNNFPRFIENWAGVNSNISGSLMEFERSRFATAPQVQLMEISLGNYSNKDRPLTNDQANSIFGYAQRYKNNTNNGRLGFYEAPERNWGFDVGLLSQLPDLFSQRFTAPDAGAPNEFFREVGRDDEWINTLLCAKAIPSENDATEEYSRLPVAINNRPSSCP